MPKFRRGVKTIRRPSFALTVDFLKNFHTLGFAKNRTVFSSILTLEDAENRWLPTDPPVVDCGERIPPVFDENYDKHYELNWWEGKRVLDIGADVGSTADYFLRKGAREVIAVEGSEGYYVKLVENSKRIANITPVLKWISCVDDIASLIAEYKPDLVKMDCEGCEAFLPDVNDSVVASVPEYVVETHTRNADGTGEKYEAVKKKLLDCGFDIKRDYFYVSGVRVIYARRKEI